MPLSTYFNILYNLPNELLFLTIQDLNNEDIQTLHSIPSIRSRLQGLFYLISDISNTRYFKDIPQKFNLKQFISSSDLLSQTHHYYLWVIVEINDLQNSSVHLPKLSNLIKNKISIYDDYIGIEGDPYQTWMQNLSPLTSLVIFENLTKLELSDIKLDPELFEFPNLIRLKLTRCQSLNEKKKFNWPKLQILVIEGRFESLNKSIDFKNSTFTKLSLTSIKDMETWNGIENSSMEQITIYQGDKLVNFIGLNFKNVKFFTIKDTDIKKISYWNCPELITLHLEQYINSNIEIHDLNLPKLEFLLVWCFQLKQFFNLYIPKIFKASIMLHNEPLEDQIDLNPFDQLKSLQICDASEILTVCNLKLEHLEIRGPLNHQIFLINCHFPHLKSLEINFNNNLRELPKFKASNLQKLSISRCTSLKDISKIQQYYPLLEEFHCEYSVLSLFQNIDFTTLKKFHYICSTSNQSIKIINCSFPSLIIFEINNLETRSNNMEPSSVIQLDHIPLLTELSIINLNIKNLQIINKGNLQMIRLNSKIENLSIFNCNNLKKLDLCKIPNLKTFHSSKFPKLISLTCDPIFKNFQKIETPLLERIENDQMIRYVKKLFPS